MDRKGFFKNSLFAALSIAASKFIPTKQAGLPKDNTDCKVIGGIRDVYFIPCDKVMSEANIHDITWWKSLSSNNFLKKKQS